MELKEKQVCQELYEVWKGAKEDEDGWPESFTELPEKHQHEYLLTAQRILRLTKPPLLADEEMILRRIAWINHGHQGMYGDDGEMQCAACLREYGFYDWKRTPIVEIESKMADGNIRKLWKNRNEERQDYECHR